MRSTLRDLVDADDLALGGEPIGRVAIERPAVLLPELVRAAPDPRFGLRVDDPLPKLVEVARDVARESDVSSFD